MKLNLEDLIKCISEEGATDIHIKAEGEIYCRKNREINKHSLRTEKEEIESFFSRYADLNDEEKFNRYGSIDKGIGIKNLRIRMNIYRTEEGKNIAVRILGKKKVTLESLKLPEEAEKLIFSEQGLILITGATGSGKSTTLSAVISEISRKKNKHIIMIEDPVEYRHESGSSLVTQIEIGRDADSFESALKASLRQDPDIIAVGEIRDKESLEIALRAAETGHLVISTLHTNSAAETVERISEMSRENSQSQIRYQLSRTLKLVLSQELRTCRNGIYPVFEILVPNSAVRNMIRKNRIFQIQDAISVSRELGMMTKERYLEHISEKKSFI